MEPLNIPGSDLSLSELVVALKQKLRLEHGLDRGDLKVPVDGPDFPKDVLPIELKVWYDAAIVSDKRRYNTILPIHKLPPEVLIHIFSFLLPPLHWIPPTLPTPPNGHGRNCLCKLSKWEYAPTSVCAHWRSLSLSDVWLWNSMTLPRADRGGRELGRQLLVRTGTTVPINIREPIVSDPFFLSLGEQDRARLKSLQLWDTPFVSHASHREVLPCLKDYDAPNLESLALFLPGASQLPPILSGNQASLKHLALKGCRRWTEGNAFTSLTHLALFHSGDVGRWGNNLTPSEFVRELAHSPLLEYLLLFSAGPQKLFEDPTEEEETIHTAPVVMKNLRTIIVAFVQFSPRALLLSMGVPADCMVHVRDYSEKRIDRRRFDLQYNADYPRLFDEVKVGMLRGQTFTTPPTQPTSAVVQLRKSSTAPMKVGMDPRHERNSVTFLKDEVHLRLYEPSASGGALEGTEDVFQDVENVWVDVGKDLDQMEAVTRVVETFPGVKSMNFVSEVDYVEVVDRLAFFMTEKANLGLEAVNFVPMSASLMEWYPREEVDKVAKLQSESPFRRSLPDGRSFVVAIGPAKPYPPDPVDAFESDIQV